MSLCIRIDTRALTDAKILEAGPDAFWILIRGRLLSRKHATGGFIADPAMPLVGIGLGSKRLRRGIARLIDLGLWTRLQNGYQEAVEK